MSDRDPDPDRLHEFEDRLRRARDRKSARQEERGPSKLGIAFRLSTEFVAAAFVGGGIGWGLDRLFGTSPILLLVMFVLGVAAGFRNVIRAANKMNETSGSGSNREPGS
jgi:ATP synthase protein I